MLIAPDGISGNLVFRTLHFLGGGKALGAPILQHRQRLHRHVQGEGELP